MVAPKLGKSGVNTTVISGWGSDPYDARADLNLDGLIDSADAAEVVASVRTAGLASQSIGRRGALGALHDSVLSTDQFKVIRKGAADESLGIALNRNGARAYSRSVQDYALAGLDHRLRQAWLSETGGRFPSTAIIFDGGEGGGGTPNAGGARQCDGCQFWKGRKVALPAIPNTACELNVQIFYTSHGSAGCGASINDPDDCLDTPCEEEIQLIFHTSCDQMPYHTTQAGAFGYRGTVDGPVAVVYETASVGCGNYDYSFKVGLGDFNNGEFVGVLIEQKLACTSCFQFGVEVPKPLPWPLN